jgi:transcriptional regulatory protein LevR
MDLYQSSLLAVFTTIQVLYTITHTPLQSLLESQLYSQLKSVVERLFVSLLDRLRERAWHPAEYSFPWEAFD